MAVDSGASSGGSLSGLAGQILREAVRAYDTDDIERLVVGYNPVLAAWNTGMFAAAGDMTGSFRTIGFAAVGQDPEVSLSRVFRLGKRLPAVRLPAAAELAAQARSAPLMARLEALASWLGQDGRPVTDGRRAAAGRRGRGRPRHGHRARAPAVRLGVRADRALGRVRGRAWRGPVSRGARLHRLAVGGRRRRQHAARLDGGLLLGARPGHGGERRPRPPRREEAEVPGPGRRRRGAAVPRPADRDDRVRHPGRRPGRRAQRPEVRARQAPVGRLDPRPRRPGALAACRARRAARRRAAAQC